MNAKDLGRTIFKLVDGYVRPAFEGIERKIDAIDAEIAKLKSDSPAGRSAGPGHMTRHVEPEGSRHSPGLVLKDAGRAPQMDDLRAYVDQRISALEERVAAGPFRYEGTFSAEKTYTAGSVVTSDGSLWYAHETTRATPGTSHDWQLCVRKGQRGKDGKDAGDADR